MIKYQILHNYELDIVNNGKNKSGHQKKKSRSTPSIPSQERIPMDKEYQSSFVQHTYDLEKEIEEKTFLERLKKWNSMYVNHLNENDTTVRFVWWFLWCMY